MIILNKTRYKTDYINGLALKHKNRLYRSKSGAIQLIQPDGYLTLTLELDRIGEVVIVATFEWMQSWKLD